MRWIPKSVSRMSRSSIRFEGMSDEELDALCDEDDNLAGFGDVEPGFPQRLRGPGRPPQRRQVHAA